MPRDGVVLRSAQAPQIGIALSVGLLVASLLYLQVLDDEKDLLRWLYAFGAIAIAALLCFATRPIPQGAANSLCLVASGVFFGYLIFRALTSPAPYIARPDLYAVLAALTVYGLTLGPLSSPLQRFAIVASLLGFALVHVAIAVVQAAQGGNLSLLIPALGEIGDSSRATGLCVNPNHLAGLLEILALLGLSIACWSRRPKWAKVLIAYLTAACFIGIALTGSRGGYLSSVVGLLAFVGLSFVALKSAGISLVVKSGAVGLLLLAAAATTLWFLIDQNVTLSGRFEKIVTDEGRLTLWKAAIEQWKLQPWVGTGSGTYLFYGRQFRAASMQLDPVEVHNDYLHLLGEYGLLGAAGFLFFFLVHVRYGLRTFVSLGPSRIAGGAPPLSDRLALNIGALAAIAAYVMHSAVDTNLHIPANALLMAFVFGIIANPGLNPPSPETGFFPRSRLATFVGAALAGVLLLQCCRLIPGEYYARLARTALWDEDPAAAIEFAQKALTFENQNPNLWFYLGRASVALGLEAEEVGSRFSHYEDALAAFDQGHRLVPLDGSYPLEMAHVYGRLGRFAEADAMYHRALARDPRAEYIRRQYQEHLEAWRDSAPADMIDRIGKPPQKQN